ncbi:MAG: hypothetical protein H0T45_09760, partial [Pyrinomonadaceae bacterium]|nr:hypothetical protein [Pyrinomonadaceae bacterium]
MRQNTTEAVVTGGGSGPVRSHNMMDRLRLCEPGSINVSRHSTRSNSSSGRRRTQLLVATSTTPTILSAMNDVPRQTLRELIDKYGPDLCSDAGRCGGLLRDLCGAHRREINILIGALKERVPLDLLAARSAMPRALLLSQLAKRLEDQLAFTEEAARWAVDSWALALGVVTDADVEKRERERAESARPSATTTTRPSPEDYGGQRAPEARASVPPPSSPPPPPAIPQPQPRPHAPRVQPPIVPQRPPRPTTATPTTALPPSTGGTN